MEKIRNFIKSFTTEDIGKIEKIRNSYFLIDKDVEKIKDKIEKNPFAAGLFLGESKKSFIPSTNLLDILSKKTEKKIFVNRKTAWLFLCDRDIFGSGIEKSNAKKGLVLVQNDRDENLGYGEIIAELTQKDKVVVKNLFDRGNFLRRERNNSKKEVKKWQKKEK